MNSEDLALARGIAAKDAIAVARAYDAHADVMYAVALRLCGNRHDAEDLTHDAWIRATLAASRFRGNSRLRTWLVGIVVNRWRETRRHDHDQLLTEEHLAPLHCDPSRRIDLETAIAAMPKGYREVLVLHDVEGFTHDEIGDMLSIQLGTSKSQLARGRAWLRRALNEGAIGHDIR